VQGVGEGGGVTRAGLGVTSGGGGIADGETTAVELAYGDCDAALAVGVADCAQAATAKLTSASPIHPTRIPS
jgi:hypothetical protein